MVIKELVMRTLTQPAGAAAELIELGLKRDVLWLGLILAAVLNALFFSVSFYAAPANAFGGHECRGGSPARVYARLFW